MLRAEHLIVVFRALLVFASMCWAPCVHVPVVHADDLSDFEAARARYDRHDYARAVESFRKLVGSDPPRISNTLLVLESRKYYAASLLFLGVEGEARLQFRLLLQQEPDYAIDPLSFPTEVVALFDDVKLGLRRDLDLRREAELSQKREAEAKLRSAELLRAQNLSRLRELAEQAEIRRENSRWIATVPFGVGQFQNGHRRLGVSLAVTQGLAALTSVITFVGHQSYANERPAASDVEEVNRPQRQWFAANIVSFSTFAALAVAGIIDAHLRFVPERVSFASRPLPEDLDRWAKEQAAQLTGGSAPGPPP